MSRKDANVAGTLSGHASWVLGVAFGSDGQKFASSSSDHTVKIWELAQRQCLHTFNEHSDQVSINFFAYFKNELISTFITFQVWAVKYHPEKNNLVVSVSEDKSINLYEYPQ